MRFLSAAHLFLLGAATSVGVALGVNSQTSRGLARATIDGGTEFHECGEVIGTASKDDIKKILAILAQSMVLGDQGNAAVSAMLNAIPDYNVQAVKICGSCQEVFQKQAGKVFLFDQSGEASFKNYCGSNNFGYDTRTSALMLFPILDGEIVKAEVKASIWMHGSIVEDFEAPSQIYPANILDMLGPSADVESQTDSLLNTYFNLLQPLVATTAGAVSIVPDYFGFGENYDGPRSHTVANAYRAATAPMWFAAEEKLEELSNGCSRLADEVTVSGYSEGGYAAVAAASAIEKLGVTILSVQAGGGSYRFSSVQMVKALERMLNGQFPNEMAFYLALIGGAYSATDDSNNTDLANANSGQDLLAPKFLPSGDLDLTAMVDNGMSREDLSAAILQNTNSVTETWNPDFVSFLTDGIAQFSLDPCNDLDPVAAGVEKLCDAVRQNDLNDLLESVSFNVLFCHSENDNIVDYGNLPDSLGVKNNLNTVSDVYNGLDFLKPDGDHFQSAPICLVTSMLPFCFLSPETTAYEATPFDCSESEPTPSPVLGAVPTMQPAASSFPTSSPFEDSRDLTSSSFQVGFACVAISSTVILSLLLGC